MATNAETDQKYYFNDEQKIDARQVLGYFLSVPRVANHFGMSVDGFAAVQWLNRVTLMTRLHALANRIGEYAVTTIKDRQNESSGTSRPRTFAGKSASELWDLASTPVEWLVKDVFSCDQPTIFGAKQKSLKTTLLTDLAVSLASGLPWLSKFDVPKRRRVLFVTGGSLRSGGDSQSEAGGRVSQFEV